MKSLSLKQYEGQTLLSSQSLMCNNNNNKLSAVGELSKNKNCGVRNEELEAGLVATDPGPGSHFGLIIDCLICCLCLWTLLG